MKAGTLAKLGKTRKPGSNSHAQGIGYYIPDNVSIQDWRKIKQKWDQKLADSGFNELEQYSHALDGHFLPTFKQNSIEKNQKTQAGAIPAGIEGYFDYCSTFYELADWKKIFNNKRFQRKWSLMREIFRLHKDGVSYGDMRISLTGKQSSYMVRFDVAASHEQFHQRRSKYWLFIQTSSILEQMWLWHATAPEGQLTPYDLKHMQCTGITQAVIDQAETLYKPRPTDQD